MMKNLFFVILMKLMVVLREMIFMGILHLETIIVCCHMIYVRISCFVSECGFFGMVKGFLLTLSILAQYLNCP